MDGAFLAEPVDRVRDEFVLPRAGAGVDDSHLTCILLPLVRKVGASADPGEAISDEHDSTIGNRRLASTVDHPSVKDDSLELFIGLSYLFAFVLYVVGHRGLTCRQIGREMFRASGNMSGGLAKAGGDPLAGAEPRNER